MDVLAATAWRLRLCRMGCRWWRRRARPLTRCGTPVAAYCGCPRGLQELAIQGAYLICCCWTRCSLHAHCSGTAVQAPKMLLMDRKVACLRTQVGNPLSQGADHVVHMSEGIHTYSRILRWWRRRLGRQTGHEICRPYDTRGAAGAARVALRRAADGQSGRAGDTSSATGWRCDNFRRCRSCRRQQRHGQPAHPCKGLCCFPPWRRRLRCCIPRRAAGTWRRRAAAGAFARQHAAAAGRVLQVHAGGALVQGLPHSACQRRRRRRWWRRKRRRRWREASAGVPRQPTPRITGGAPKYLAQSPLAHDLADTSHPAQCVAVAEGCC